MGDAPATLDVQPVGVNGMTQNMVHPTVAAAICRQPARRAGIVVHLYLYRPTQKRLSLYGVVPFNQTGYIRYGASPWRGWSGDESSPLHCSVYEVVPFTRTSCIRNVAGGRLPMELWCDCPRQSIDFDSLREAPPLQYICSVLEKIVNCQLSIVNSKKLSTVNCQLSTVNSISPNASSSLLFSSGSFTATRYQPSPRPG
mgnify:CR=1 FL=1